jgi:hypothetical protein
MKSAPPQAALSPLRGPRTRLIGRRRERQGSCGSRPATPSAQRRPPGSVGDRRTGIRSTGLRTASTCASHPPPVAPSGEICLRAGRPRLAGKRAEEGSTANAVALSTGRLRRLAAAQYDESRRTPARASRTGNAGSQVTARRGPRLQRSTRRSLRRLARVSNVNRQPIGTEMSSSARGGHRLPLLPTEASANQSRLELLPVVRSDSLRGAFRDARIRSESGCGVPVGIGA